MGFINECLIKQTCLCKSLLEERFLLVTTGVVRCVKVSNYARTQEASSQSHLPETRSAEGYRYYFDVL